MTKNAKHYQARFRLRSAAICTLLLAVCACSENSNEAAQTNEAVELGRAPISLETALSDQIVSPSMATDACPYLSDATAISTVRNSDDFQLRTASNSKCVWNRNIGFEIAVTVEAAASAKPIAQRLYNLDNPPIIAPQSGPGLNAAVALDPTWNERDPRPYAFGFNLDDRYVFIRTTGVRTSVEQLRKTADEIAAKLPSAPEVSGGVVAVPPAAFDVCGIWSEAALRDLFGVGEGGNLSRYSDDGKTCITSIYPSEDFRQKISLDFIFSAPTPSEYEFRKSKGWSPEELAGKSVLFKQDIDEFGEANQYMVMTDKGNFSLTILSKSKGMKEKAEQLFENALSRFKD